MYLKNTVKCEEKTGKVPWATTSSAIGRQLTLVVYLDAQPALC